MSNIIQTFPKGKGGSASFPAGGTTGQALVKKTNADNDVEWGDVKGAVDSVNGQTGAVTIDADDISDSNTTNKFVTASEKSTWNSKQNALTAGTNIGISGSTISATNTIALNFSTSEQAIGTWVDGRTLYQKTINFGALPNTSDKSVAHGISSIRSIVQIWGYVKNPNTNTFMPLPDSNIPSGATQAMKRVIANSTNITVSTGIDAHTWTECYITLRYTK